FIKGLQRHSVAEKLLIVKNISDHKIIIQIGGQQIILIIKLPVMNECIQRGLFRFNELAFCYDSQNMIHIFHAVVSDGIIITEINSRQEMGSGGITDFFLNKKFFPAETRGIKKLGFIEFFLVMFHASADGPASFFSGVF